MLPNRLTLPEQEGDVEEGLRHAVALAPHVSRRVSAAFRDAYVMYYKATAHPPSENLAGLLNQNREPLRKQRWRTCAPASNA